VRRLAFDLVCRRDGYSGWQRHRRAFHALAAADAAVAQREASESLRRLLAHAYDTVPHYRRLWRQAGFRHAPPATVDDLRRLPLLTQNDIRAIKSELVSNRYRTADLQLDYTGGTTSVQTSFYRDRACTTARFGRQWGVLERCGYRPGDRRGLVWGAHRDLPPRGAADTMKRRLREYASSDAVFCCTVMTPDDMRQYHARLARFRPRVLYGYPNAIEQFAQFIGRDGLAPVRVARILCTAEKLHERQRQLFERVFGGEVFNPYCSREHGCLAFECGRHAGFHVDTGNAIVEILQDGEPVPPGGTGELVITDLLNHGMPLLRHATGDPATAAAAPCGCGLPFPTFSRLEGRVAVFGGAHV